VQKGYCNEEVGGYEFTVSDNNFAVHLHKPLKPLKQIASIIQNLFCVFQKTCGVGKPLTY